MRNNVKGGSIASSRVNSLVVKETLPKPKMIKNEITPKFIENNYGIEYKTTGGKKKKYGLPERYFNPDLKVNNSKQSGGKKTCVNVKNPFDTKTSVPYPSIGIPVDALQKSIGMYQGNKCNQVTTGLDRSSPGFMEFKQNAPKYLDQLGEPIINPRVNVLGFPSADIQASNNFLYPEVTNFQIPNTIPDALAGGVRKKTQKKILKGSGSDCLSTVRSRGSYTAPNMKLSQYRMFNKTAPYLSNIDMAKGAANNFKENKLIIGDEYAPGNNPPQAYNYDNGISTNKFKGGSKSNKNK